MTVPFKLYAAVDAFEKSGDEFPMRIGGIVSTGDLDLEQEQLVQEGLDFTPFLTNGWFNDNHSSKMADVLGYPTKAFLVQKGEVLPNGKVASTKGWWAEGYLLNTQRGRETWEIAQALQGSPRRLGFSIEGKVAARDRRNPSKVLKGIVRHVAITHIPVNTGTELNAFAKALTAGHAINSDDIGAEPGDGGPLREEDLENEEADTKVSKEEANKANGDLVSKSWASAIRAAVRRHPPINPLTLTPSEAQRVAGLNTHPPMTGAVNGSTR